MEHIIQVITRLQDNGDGGYTMYMYNDEEELLKDMNEDSYKKKEVTMKDFDDDPYEYGYIGSETIKIIEENGVFKLGKIISLQAGQ